MKYSIVDVDKFPSPIKVLYISIQSATFKRSFDNIAFPSPIGVLYISMRQSSSITFVKCVSVPYWGSLYFNTNKDYVDVDFIDAFPSPIGVLYISIFQHSLRTGRTVFRFRPLLRFFLFQTNPKKNISDSHSFRPLLGFFLFQR